MNALSPVGRIDRWTHFLRRTRRRFVGMLILLLVTVGVPARAERIKDIVEIQGVRGNPLTGVGLVIGLAGTGDTGLLSRQMLTNILRESGLVLSPTELTGGNIAVVMVTAELGPFDREGMRIDVDVSALGDAKSLQGAMLLPTPLKGLDGQVYAVAQGGVSLGGWSAGGKQATMSKNHQTVGRVADGAIVEKAELASFIEQVAGQRFITFSLRNSDFSTAQRISEIINQSYADSAVVLDAASIKVMVPSEITQRDIIGFLDEITQKEVTVDMPATVVINERTGTIVVGENVGISSVAISQGSLVVKVKETAQVSQPTAPFSEAGSTEVIPETLVGVEEQNAYLIPVERAVTVSELAKTLNAIGASPRDLIAIFNALKEAGALQAKLVIM
ncbi:MAG TPA: flagellar basal body P-ring protein FlgI [Sedimentisphaerales bacterium]|nr:flagellar basal body P-ring protein FlgI [Sedimentisphaerales bacterium]HRV47574.1 flagellar basal body P-ring protein FlgI [Sedimentisphaerales bacterium]